MQKITGAVVAALLLLIAANTDQAYASVARWEAEIIPTSAAQVERQSEFIAAALDQKEVECLARNMYFEARGEGETGMKAVAFVTQNRVLSTEWPETICDVVYEGRRDRKGRYIGRLCQFSWVCDGRPDVPMDHQMWSTTLHIAREVLATPGADPTAGAVFYHATRVRPRWARAARRIKTVIIGSHIFYADRFASPYIQPSYKELKEGPNGSPTNTSIEPVWYARPLDRLRGCCGILCQGSGFLGAGARGLLHALRRNESDGHSVDDASAPDHRDQETCSIG